MEELIASAGDCNGEVGDWPENETRKGHELTRIVTEETERQENGNGMATERHKRARNGERQKDGSAPQDRNKKRITKKMQRKR